MRLTNDQMVALERIRGRYERKEISLADAKYLLHQAGIKPTPRRSAFELADELAEKHGTDHPDDYR